MEEKPYRDRWHIAAVLVICLLIQPGLAQSVPSGEERVARLIHDLGSESYAARRDASHSLGKLEPADLGRAGRAALERATTSDDDEVALRAERLLRRLTAKELWSASQFVPPDRPAPFLELVEAIGNQTGNRFLLGNALSSYHNATVAVDQLPTDFWPAIDTLCRQAGNSVRQHYDPRRRGLIVVGRPPGKNPIAYVGPIRVELTNARRSFVEQLDYTTGASNVEHTFQVNLQLAWEDRLRLVAYRSGPEVVLAETASGERLRQISPASPDWNVLGRNTRQLSATLRFEPPPVGDRVLRRLVLKWPMMAVGEMAELAIDAPTAGAIAHQDDLALSIDAFHVEPTGSCRATVLVARDLVHPEPAEVLLHESQVDLYDADGNAFVRHATSAALVGASARWTVTFRPPDGEATPTTIRLTYPRIRDVHDVLIEFQDVPLPVARPN